MFMDYKSKDLIAENEEWTFRGINDWQIFKLEENVVWGHKAENRKIWIGT